MNHKSLAGLSLLVAASACTTILGGFDYSGKAGTGGTGTGTGGTGTGGTGTGGTGTGGGTGGTGGTCAHSCSAAADCPMTNGCVQVLCQAGCCAEKPLSDAGACVPCASTVDCSGGLVCVSHACQPPTCTDQMTDGDETDTDCGGKTCVAQGKTCAFGGKCMGDPDCASGTCTSGKCDATVAMSGVSQPAGLVFHINQIYVLDNTAPGGRVWRFANVGTIDPHAITTDINSGNGDTSQSLVVANSYAYWTSIHLAVGDTEIDRVLAGTSSAVSPSTYSPRSDASDGMNVNGGMVADGAKLYAAFQYSAGDNGIAAFDLSGNNIPVASIGMIDEVPAHLAVNSGSLFWTSGTQPGYVALAPKTGWSGTYTKIATGLAQPGAIAADDSFVYWLNAGDGTVVQMSVTGGKQTVLATGGQGLTGLAVDSSSVYWTEKTANGSVKKTAIGGGGSVITLASGQASPQDIAVDSAYVYWTNAGDGTVKRVLK